MVKADGLAAGKGAIVCADRAEADRAIADMLERRVFGEAGARVVVEEFLEGEEVSVFALTDGRTRVPARLRPGPQGRLRRRPRSEHRRHGGLLAGPRRSIRRSPDEVTRTVLEPTIRAMAAEGRPYRGVLFAGLMLTAAGVRVLEYNVRFGDPECQALMPRLAEDLLPLCQAVAEGRGLPASVDLAARGRDVRCSRFRRVSGRVCDRHPDRRDRSGRSAPGRRRSSTPGPPGATGGC